MPHASRIRPIALVVAVVALAAALLACLPAGAHAATGGASASDVAAAGGGTGAGASTTPAPTTARRGAARAGGAAVNRLVLVRGTRGQAVRTLQELLTQAGLPTPAVGIFGPQTERNVKSFQRRSRLRADGVVGPHTLAKLRRAAAARTTPAPAPEPPAGTAPADPLAPPAPATLLPDGTASPPPGAPAEVAAAIAAGNRIASLPYRWGGGHARWEDSGYDCSGSVGYALHGGGLLDATSDSTGFMSYGEAGPGRWITLYANRDHVYLVVAGLRFDTSGAKPSRWQATARSGAGFVVRHPAGF